MHCPVLTQLEGQMLGLRQNPERQLYPEPQGVQLIEVEQETGHEDEGVMQTPFWQRVREPHALTAQSVLLVHEPGHTFVLEHIPLTHVVLLPQELDEQSMLVLQLEGQTSDSHFPSRHLSRTPHPAMEQSASSKQVVGQLEFWHVWLIQ
tara:strand:- start:7556 stop:8002 length:447 start_codon:yes stop_codon:yes gene_type:complete